MKPLQVGVLMAVAAVGGGLLMKFGVRSAPPAPAEVATESVTSVPTVPATPEPVTGEPRHMDAEARHKIHPSRIASAQLPEQPANQPAVQADKAPSAPAVAPPAQPAPISQPPVREEPVVKNDPPPPVRVTLASGTLIAVRTIEALSSDRNSPGDSFSATLTQPIVVDGYVIAERGARAEGRVVQSQRAGRVKGASDLALQLTRITTADGQHIALDTENFEKQGTTRTKEEAAKVGGGAALGAIIGAIAGGGKGAGIGAGVGSAAGAGDVLLTHGKQVALPSESMISFRLRAPVTITEKR